MFSFRPTSFKMNTRLCVLALALAAVDADHEGGRLQIRKYLQDKSKSQVDYFNPRRARRSCPLM